MKQLLVITQFFKISLTGEMQSLEILTVKGLDLTRIITNHSKIYVIKCIGHNRTHRQLKIEMVKSIEKGL
jgi:hypothetical protein